MPDVKIRKPKKKKAKSSRVKALDEDDIVLPAEVPEDQDTKDDMSVDVVEGQSKKRAYQDMSFVDDDDLQASLAAQRRAALKKRRKLRPEDIAEQLRLEAAAVSEEGQVPESEGGLVIDETSEFVANLQKPTVPQARKPTVASRADVQTSMAIDPDDDGDTQMQESYANVEDDVDRAERMKREESESANITANGLDDEATLTSGLGSTLKLLKDRGIIRTEETGDINAIFRKKQLFLAERQRHEADAERKARSQRERDRNTGRLDRMTAREKEDYARQQNTYRDQQESRQLAEHFNRDYKPNVELKYIDDYGRSLNQKEAFKELSHQFHGKGSGKLKTEKKLRKIQDEKRNESKSALDVSQVGGMSGATSQQLKKQRQAGVRLA